MNKADFNLIAKAILLYYEHRNSLFADHLITEKLDQSPEIIRSKIGEWSRTSPENLITHLEPEKIKRCIAKTTALMRNKQINSSNILIEAMTEHETEHDGVHLSIHYKFTDTPFGKIIIASTSKGICHLAFVDGENKGSFEQLKKRFPKAEYEEVGDDLQHDALSFFESKQDNYHPVHLHLKGSLFQISTWKKLIDIPFGGLMSYSALADDIKDSHALGAAVGSNPVAYIIPCHRTVRASGEFGDYHWGRARKAALICIETILSKGKFL